MLVIIQDVLAFFQRTPPSRSSATPILTPHCPLPSSRPEILAQSLQQPMKPLSQPPTDIPTLCSTHDHGGGVLSISPTPTFIIYTTTTLPPTLHHLLARPPTSLALLAATIAQSIPIHLDPSTLILRALPCPCPTRRPWFFLNAAHTTSHAIAGRDSALATLLSVLRRPWCALELCCTASTEGLRALLAFTRHEALAGHGYGAAAMLLTHELASRDQVQDRDRERRFSGGRRRRSDLNDVRLREMCTAVFAGSVGSYNGFWLRLVAVVGVELGMGYSRLGLLLDGEDGDLVPASVRDRVGHRLRRSRSLSSVVEGEEDARSIPRWHCGEVGRKGYFMWVYAQVLKRFGDTEVYTATR